MTGVESEGRLHWAATFSCHNLQGSCKLLKVSEAKPWEEVAGGALPVNPNRTHKPEFLSPKFKPRYQVLIFLGEFTGDNLGDLIASSLP